MFKHILIPLDGSQAAERVLQRIDPLGAPEAIRHLVTVVPGSAGRAPTPAEQLRGLEAESYLSFLAAERSAGVRAEVRRGEVVEEIFGAAAAVGADLIAVSSHGESARPGVPCGSVAARLLLTADVPVLVIGAFTDETGFATACPARILVTLDGSRESESALAPARNVAAAWGAEIILLHVIEPLWAAGDSASAGMLARETEATLRRLQELAHGLERDGIKARVLLSRGEPAGEIVAQVVRRRAGLLCLSTAGRGAAGRLIFGAVARKLIGSLPVPAIIVRAVPAPPA